MYSWTPSYLGGVELVWVYVSTWGLAIEHMEGRTASDGDRAVFIDLFVK